MQIQRWCPIVFVSCCIAACATHGAGFDAYGYLTPAPTGEGAFIGTFETRHACEDAADEWMSRQVVGNPVSSACYPVDRR